MASASASNSNGSFNLSAKDKPGSTSDPHNWVIFKHVDSSLIDQIKSFFVFGESGMNALFITNDDQVYGLGLNEHGILGIGNAIRTFQPKLVPELSGKNVVKIAWGTSPHVLALTHEGKVFAWGSNSSGQLGQGNQINSCVPLKVNGELENKVVIDIACGSSHSVALLESGNLYGWGNSEHMQIISRQCYFLPAKMYTSTASAVSCSANSTHTIISGNIKSKGSNQFGQLATGWALADVNPGNVSYALGVRAVQVVCGPSHCVMLTDNGHVYAWGCNEKGQIGSPQIAKCLPPVLVPGLGKVREIVAVPSKDLSLALTDSGRIYAWGMGIAPPILTPFETLQDAFSCYGQSITYQLTSCKRQQIEYLPDNLMDSLKKSFNDSTTSDLKFQVEGQVINVHRTILTIRSEHFRSMFQHEWKESSQDIIEIKDTLFVVYSAFLRYLYTDEIDDSLELENLVQLLDLANCYCEARLKLLCEAAIKAKISVDNVALIYLAAVKTESNVLQELAVEFSAKNLEEVMASDAYRELTDDTLRDFTAKAVNKRLAAV